MKKSTQLIIDRIDALRMLLESQATQDTPSMSCNNTDCDCDCDCESPEPVYQLTAAQLADFATAFATRAIHAAEVAATQYIQDHGHDFLSLDVMRADHAGIEVLPTLRASELARAVAYEIQEAATYDDASECAVEVQDVLDVMDIERVTPAC